MHRLAGYEGSRLEGRLAYVRQARVAMTWLLGCKLRHERQWLMEHPKEAVSVALAAAHALELDCEIAFIEASLNGSVAALAENPQEAKI